MKFRLTGACRSEREKNNIHGSVQILYNNVLAHPDYTGRPFLALKSGTIEIPRRGTRFSGEHVAGRYVTVRRFFERRPRPRDSILIERIIPIAQSSTLRDPAGTAECS